jgi:hypothetical protein
LAKFSEAKKKERIQFLIDRLNSGYDVQARDLKAVLTSEQWDAYQVEWHKQKDYRSEKKPWDVQKYEKMLSKALLAYGRWNAYCQKSSAKEEVKRSLESKHLADFERAAEFLQECYEGNHGLVIWFDRGLDPKSYSIDPDGMPRVITSRSLMNQASTPAHVLTKRQLKLETLKTALADISSPADAVSTAHAPKMTLDSRMARLKKLMKS